MCDYSLMEFPNRLAVEGEVLVVHRFRSGSLGLAAAAECEPNRMKTAQKKSFWERFKDLLFLPEPPQTAAVCIPPGARLVLHDVPASLQKQLHIGPDEEVTFMQTSAAENRHRDAVRFRTGHVLRLQELTVGQRVQVMDLGSSAEEEPNISSSYETIGRW
ncbi:MAG TPA: hypothetical protein VMB03_15940 [Bryobacteraceae bacterium]|nr:hypothetical protein [Bryobacteraceae bacterium]